MSQAENRQASESPVQHKPIEVKKPPVLFDRTQSLFGKIEGLLGGRLLAYWNNHRGSVCHNDVVAFYELLEWWAALAGGLLGVWLGMGLVAQHEPGHNLYWKWLHPVVPLLVVAAAGAADRLVARWRRGLVGTALAVALLPGWGLWTAWRETERQLAVSRQLYAPQLRLARWIEENVPPGTAMLVDNIPGCWIERRPYPYTLFTWMDLPVRPGDPADFERFLSDEAIRWVLWFREDWTQAPRIAPFLGGPTEVLLPGGTRLVPVDREDGYGWVFYRVESTGAG